MKKNWNCFIVWIVFVNASYGQLVKADAGNTLWYDKPAVAWEEALPLGNGRSGAMVFGGVLTERLQLNDNTLWSGYPDAGNNVNAPKYLPLVRKAVDAGDYDLAAAYWKKMQGPYSARYLHMADLFLDFQLKDSSATSYQRSLDLRTAVASTSYSVKGTSFQREVFLSHPDKALTMRITANRKKSITFKARLKSKLKYKTSGQDNLLILRGKAPMHVANRESESLQVVYDDWIGEGMNFEIRLAIKNEGGTITTTDSVISVSGADAVTIVVTEATSFNGYNRSPGTEGRDPSTEAQARMSSAVKKTYAELKRAHVADHQSLFNRVKLELGSDPAVTNLPTDKRMLRFNEGKADPELVKLYYQFGRYLLIASSRPGSPPANLQGIWNDHVQPPWGSNYTTNINTEMNYWLAESANLSECHEPLFDFLSSLARNGAQTAKVNYGISRGWCAHHNSDIWAKSSPPGGFEWDPRSQARWACWPMSGAWLSTHLWEHYLFTGDEKFLRDRGWPLMKGAAEFLLAWLVQDESGYLVTNPSTSPENTLKIDGKEFQISKATTMDMAIIKELFGSCIHASEILKVDRDFQTELKNAFEKLYPYHIGKYGQLQEWFKDWDDPKDKHRHLSHLFGLHPGAQITPDKTPELAAAAKQSLIHRGDMSTGWSMAWKINWWGRLRDGNHAFAILKQGLTYIDPKKKKETMGGGGTYPNLFDAHPPFQIDGNFGATAGVNEMLLQSHAGEVFLLPALPTELNRGSVEGIRSRGGFQVSIAWENSKLKNAKIESMLGGNCRLRTNIPVKIVETDFKPASGANPNILMQSPGAPSFKTNGNATLQELNVSPGFVIDFVTEKGKSYTVVPL